MIKANDYYKLRERLQFFRGRRSALAGVIVDAKRELHDVNDSINRLVRTLNRFESHSNMNLTSGDDDA